MHSCDIIAWGCDGEIYCPDCKPERAGGPHADEPWPVFADNYPETVGATCGACGACYVEGSGIRAPEWRTAGDLEGVRWARCERCNGQYPYDEPDADIRLDAITGKLHCPNCHGALHF